MNNTLRESIQNTPKGKQVMRAKNQATANLIKQVTKSQNKSGYEQYFMHNKKIYKVSDEIIKDLRRGAYNNVTKVEMAKLTPKTLMMTKTQELQSAAGVTILGAIVKHELTINITDKKSLEVVDAVKCSVKVYEFKAGKEMQPVRRSFEQLNWKAVVQEDAKDLETLKEHFKNATTAEQDAEILKNFNTLPEELTIKKLEKLNSDSTYVMYTSV